MSANTPCQYKRIYNDIISLIRSGAIRTGDKLPTEFELMDQYNVSRITARKSLTLLQEEGIVIRQTGRGTYLTPEGAGKLIPLPMEKEVFAVAKDQAKTSARKLGLVVDDIEESYGLRLFYSLDQAASRYGFRLHMRPSYGDQEKEAEEIAYLREMGAEGIFILPARAQYYNPAVLRLLLEDYPVLIVDCMLRGIQAHAIASDNALGARRLTEHLISLGHQHIALISVNRALAVSLEDRYRGYRNALEENGLPFLRANILDTLSWPAHSKVDVQAAQEIISQIRRFLEGCPHITAVIAAQYSLAPLVQRVANQLGLRVPADLSIVTFDECYDLAGGFIFTHVKQDEESIANRAMQQMNELIAGNPIGNTDYLPPHLMIGSTSAAPRPSAHSAE